MTPLCELLGGIEFPVVAFSHCRDVVAAVSRAGGLGVLGATRCTPDELETELRWIDDHTGGRPYGVDVLIPMAGAGGQHPTLAEIEAMIPPEHRRFFDDLLDRYGVDHSADAADVIARTVSLSVGGAEDLVDVALAHPIRLIASALGPPPPSLVEAAHERGVPVAALVGKRQHAERQKAAGVDLIVAQGYEAGGHTGEIATMVLVPDVVDAVAPTPVLAAGGIAGGRQMAAAMALGAQGVWTGSVWLTTEEAETHPVVKEKMLAATASDTVRSRATTGKPARQLRTAWTDEWDGPDSPGPLPMPLQTLFGIEGDERIGRAASAGNPGARDLLTYPVGQVVGRMTQVRPAARVLHDIVEEYVDVVERMKQALDASAT
jgi:NAD(P)H-dependent flavin oxidoreductase YrpB (nitropropane dioxygenase family)